MKILLYFVLLITAEPKIDLPPNTYILTDITVKDPDTIFATVNLGYGVFLKDSIRACDYDGCESSRTRKTVTITDKELEKGRIATEAFKSLARQAKLVTLTPTKKFRDNYGRLLGSFTVYILYENKINKINMADFMKQEKFLRSQLNEE